MSEYIAFVSIQRSARGEGDVPVTVVAASGSSRDDRMGSPNQLEAPDLALTEALKIVRAALDKRAEVRA